MSTASASSSALTSFSRSLGNDDRSNEARMSRYRAGSGMSAEWRGGVGRGRAGGPTRGPQPRAPSLCSFPTSEREVVLARHRVKYGRQVRQKLGRCLGLAHDRRHRLLQPADDRGVRLGRAHPFHQLAHPPVQGPRRDRPQVGHEVGRFRGKEGRGARVDVGAHGRAPVEAAHVDARHFWGSENTSERPVRKREGGGSVDSKKWGNKKLSFPPSSRPRPPHERAVHAH